MKCSSTKKCNLTVIVKRSIKEISPTEWDSIIGSESLYRTHRFFSSVEEAGLESATYWYLLIYEGNELRASAVCSSFFVSLDLLLPQFVQKTCNFIRRFYKLFLRPRFIFCGIPVSIGKHTLSISENFPTDIALEKFHLSMKQIAEDERIKFLSFKEFPEADSCFMDKLGEFNYIKANSVPRILIYIKWQSISDYLKSMRYNYRRHILKNLKAIGIKNYSSPFHSLHSDQKSNFPVLIKKKFDFTDAKLFFEQYSNVMLQVKQKMEVLNQNFFERLSKKMSSDILLLSLKDTESTYGTVLLGKNGSQLSFLLIGMDYTNRNKYKTYYNLVYGIIAYAIDNGFTTVDLGQTTMFAKKKYGGKEEKVYFYIKAQNKIVHYILSKANKYIFPNSSVDNLRIFKDI